MFCFCPWGESRLAVSLRDQKQVTALIDVVYIGGERSHIRQEMAWRLENLGRRYWKG